MRSRIVPLRTRTLGLLAAVGLVAGAGVAAAPAGADVQLSEGCAYVHALAGQDFFATGTLQITSKAFSTGEQLRFTGISEEGVGLVVDVSFPDGEVLSQHGTSGVPIEYTVPVDSELSFALRSVPASGVHWKLDCGAPAEKQSQTISFGSTPPADLVWGRDLIGLDATASSGLPVTLTLGEDSTGCTGPMPWISGDVFTVTRPGTCIVHATQAGNDEYEAAPAATTSFVIHKRPSFLTPAKVTKGALNLFPTTFKATLEISDILGPGTWIHPYAGQQVTFAVDGTPMCTGTTDANGEVTCTAKLGWTRTVRATEYTASWAGDDLWSGTSATGVLK